MDAQRLLIFLEVARAGSLSAAARTLGWTQPAVSQHLRHLEHQAGTPLVLRHPRGIQLTEAGQALHRHAEAIATRLQAAKDELANLTSLTKGTVRIAAFPSAAATIIPATIESLTKQHPNLQIHLTEQEPPEALQSLTVGEVDIAITFTHIPTPPDEHPFLTWTPLGTDPVRLVLPPTHPFSRDDDLATLADSRWISGCPRCTAYLNAACAAAGFTPDIHHSTDDYVVTQKLVATGLAVALLPALALTAFQSPTVRPVPLNSLTPRSLWTTCHTEALQVASTRAALDALHNAAPTN